MTTRTRRRSRRLLWIVGFLLLTVPVGAWFAPTIVATTSLRQEILPRILPDAQANFTVGSASLGWLSPVRLSEVEASDTEGNTLLIIDSVVTEKTLWNLINDQTNIGKLTLTGLAVFADLRDDGSNLETAFGPLLDSEDDSPPIQCQVEIQRGKIHLHDLIARRVSQIDITQATIAHTPESDLPLEMKADGNLIDEEIAGPFQLAFVTTSSAQNQLQLAADGAPLRPLAWLLRRSVGPADVAGQLSGDMNITWLNQTDSIIELSGQAHGRQLKITADNWLEGDVLQTATASYTGKLRIEPMQVVADNVTIITDLGRLAVHGVVPGEAASGGSLSDRLLILGQADLQADGEVDLAQLAAALPQTLRIREDTTVTGGTLKFNTRGSLSNGQRKRQLTVASSNITANTGGQSVVWNQPITINASTLQGPTGPTTYSLSCQSDFIQATGDGDLNDATLTARADMTALAGRLGQFVDLRDIALAGTVDLGMRLLRDTDSGVINVAGGGQMTNLQIVAPGSLEIREPNLQLEFNGALVASDDFTNVSANSGQVTVIAGGDTLTARIAQQIAITGPAHGLPLRIEARGGLNTWSARLQSVLPLEGWMLQGDLTCTADVSLVNGEVRLTSSECDINNLVASGNGHDLREQMIRLTAVGNWSPKSQQLNASAVTLASTSWSLRGDDVAMQLLPQGPPSASGRFAFRSDIRRTIASLRSLREVPKTGLRGIVTGDVVLNMTGGVATVDVVSQIDNLVIEAAPRATTVNVVGVRPVTTSHVTQTLWSERQMKIGGRLIYNTATDALQSPKMTAETSGAKLTCAGEVTAISTAPRVNLSGEATYNLAAMMHRLRPLLGDQFQLLGNDKATFAVNGPLYSTPLAASQPGSTNVPAVVPAISPELQASASFAWESAALYGLQFGEGRLQTELRSGILDFKPMSLAVSGGKMNIAPRFYFNETPPVMTLDRGQVLQNVGLTPQMCRNWLMYVAPLLADATECQGRISMQIERATLPIHATTTGSLAGTLTIHGADVRPGSLAGSYINLVQRLRGALQGQSPEADALATPIRLVHMDEQDLLINMIDGRVHHQGLTMNLGDATIITSGSVGADQSLDLIAEIPVQDSWIEGKTYLLGLQGQTLKIPIRGTVGRPQVDNSIIQELGRKTLGGAANRLLRNEINGLIGDLLLPPDQRQPTTDANGLPRTPNALLRNLIPPDMRQPPAQPVPPAAP